MYTQKQKNHGFFSVELLIVLFIAAAFLMSGYKLFTSIMSASASSGDDKAASNLANNYLELYRYHATTPCVEKSILNELPVESEYIKDASVTINITCPINGDDMGLSVFGATPFFKKSASSKVESIVKYDGGKKTTAVKIVNNKVKIKQISGGYTFMAALGDDGQVYAWGAGSNRQLGIDSTAKSNYPVAVKTVGTPMEGKRIVKISAGGHHVLALDSEGTLYSWGRNTNGQLGTGNTTSQGLPVKVSISGTSLEGKAIKDIVASYYASAAIDSDGVVHTWGNNSYGEQGNDSLDNRTLPGLVVTSGTSMNNVPISQLASSYYSFSALGANGKVYSWGSNSQRQIGNPSVAKGDNSLLPVQTSLLGSKIISQVQCGGYHCVALGEDNNVYSWGSNSYGALGAGNTAEQTPLITVSVVGTPLEGKTISAVSANSYTSKVIDSSGTLYGWGHNTTGQLGVGTLTNVLQPTEVKRINSPIDSVKIVEAVGGNAYSAALGENGEVYTWGSNANGELGTGDFGNKNIPQSVSNGARIAALTSGMYSSGALMSNGDAYTWGCNYNGQLGNGGGDCVRRPGSDPAGTDTSGLRGKEFIILRSSDSHMFALDKTGTLYAWGVNTDSQLGDRLTADVLTPKAISFAGTLLEGEEIIDIAPATTYTLVLTKAGNVYGWGANASRQLGNNTTSDSLIPVKTQISLPAGRKIVKIAAGYTAAYALDSVGDVYSWGAATSGALGNGSTTAHNATGQPVSKASGSSLSGKTIVDIVAGTYSALVLASDGTVHAWGTASYGANGVGDDKNKTIATQLDVGNIPIRSIFSRKYTYAAVNESNDLLMWGSNGYNKQSNGDSLKVVMPTLVTAFQPTAPIDQVSIGPEYVMVLDNEKNMYGWGRNYYYNLGILIATNQTVPRAITRIQYDNVW